MRHLIVPVKLDALVLRASAPLSDWMVCQPMVDHVITGVVARPAKQLVEGSRHGIDKRGLGYDSELMRDAFGWILDEGDRDLTGQVQPVKLSDLAADGPVKAHRQQLLGDLFPDDDWADGRYQDGDLLATPGLMNATVFDTE